MSSILLRNVSRSPASGALRNVVLRNRFRTMPRSSPSSISFSTRSSTQHASSSPLKALAVGSIFATATILYSFYFAGSIEQETFNAVEPKYQALFPEDAWQPGTKVDPFLRRIEVDGRELWLLGLGVRTVSFLKIHVYAVGIYVDKDDIPKITSTLSALKSDKDAKEAALDPDTALDLFTTLLDSNVRFALRIVPSRNTDFSHLRDGFVRSIMASIKNRRIDQSADSGSGIAEIRSALGRKMTAPRNSELLLTIDDKGSLTMTYAAPREAEKERLGVVTDKTIVKALFLHYLTPPTAASEEARVSFAESIASITP
ncbi:chalcone-flavanone isomerase-domain-containing protein [Myxozyma melibiosi]|uniref:Altered inheritance of mitochondria protein 18, mitochondrial n=1 Tax=Myxozyma melibiosi TaxID=54550 RepID=A0ABR1F6Y9_9ASCO